MLDFKAIPREMNRIEITLNALVDVSNLKRYM
jgi:hypothetical protein